MKLLNCMECHDIISLHYEERKCFCGKSAGKVDINHFGEVTGPARILGIRNPDYMESLSRKSKEGNWFQIWPK